MRPEPPDDVQPPHERSPIESRLKQLQPKSPNLVVADLMAAALSAERQVSRKEASGPDRRDRPRWLALIGASAGGALVGTIVTCLVLLPRLSPAEPVLPNAASGSDARPELVNVNDQAGDDSHAVADSRIPTPDPDAPLQTRPSTAPKWSRTERLVSTRVLDINDPPSSGEPPLMAGNYARLEVLPARFSRARYSADETASASTQRAPVASAQPPTTRPRPSGKLRPLLRELLGDRPRGQL